MKVAPKHARIDPWVVRQHELMRAKQVERQRLEAELQFLDYRLSTLQFFNEELERARLSGDEESIEYIERAIADLRRKPTKGPIDRPLNFKPARNGRGKSHKPRGRAGRSAGR